MYYAAADSFLVHEFLYWPAGETGGYRTPFLYHRSLGILAKKLSPLGDRDHPWCFLNNRRVMASNQYFVLHCLLAALKKEQVKG